MNGHELSYAPAHLGGAGCTVNDDDFRAALAALFDGTTTEMGPLRFGKWWVGRRVYEAYHEDGEHSPAYCEATLGHNSPLLEFGKYDDAIIRAANNNKPHKTSGWELSLSPTLKGGHVWVATVIF